METEPQEKRKYQEVGIDIEATHLRADFGHVLCAVLKPVGKNPLVFRLDAYPSFKTRMWDDIYLINDIVRTLNNSNQTFGWYSSRYDLKFLRTRRFLQTSDGNTVEPSQTFLHFDLINLRQHYLFHNNRLDTWMQNLTDRKKSSLLPREWVLASYGDKTSMDYVVEHCIRDVMGMEEVYKKCRDTCYMTSWKRQTV